MAISDLTKMYDGREIKSVLSWADLEVKNRFEQGLDTMLAREFDGIDLSGGEWQRSSLACGLYRQSDLIILDEPTSAIVPLEESRLYQKFSEISADKIAIMVTHRLALAKIADRIVVMEKGRITAIGTQP